MSTTPRITGRVLAALTAVATAAATLAADRRMPGGCASTSRRTAWPSSQT
jgi:hypothetical protein